MKIEKMRMQLIVAIAIGILSGCTTTAPFSQKAYEQATALKVEALTAMTKATEPFTSHKQDITTLKINIEKAYEYAKGRPMNSETTDQWALIKDPSRNSFGGFLKRWEDKTSLEEKFIEQAKGIVSDGFDTVIELESGKRKPNATQKQ